MDLEPSLSKNLRSAEGWQGIAKIGEQEGATALEKVYRSYPDTLIALHSVLCRSRPFIILHWASALSLCVSVI